MKGDSTESHLEPSERWVDGEEAEHGARLLGLSIVWCLSDPERIGEVALIRPRARETLVLGRGEEATVRFVRIRPGGLSPAAPLDGRLLSRRQIEITASSHRLSLANVGSCAMKVGGVAVREASLGPGDLLELDRQLLLLVVERRAIDVGIPSEDVPFGRADIHGIVGESDAAWTLRAKLRFLGKRREAVLVTGPSGSGKELAARALHAASPSRQGPFVARSAATLPEGLVDAELFGNIRNYPNPGMAERPGLVGAADGGSLFLDEVGEMPEATQAHLLRVLDRDGEYTRLGDPKPRRSSFRFIAATNRDPSSLKHDLLARMPLRLDLPGLGERREDIPLLLRHLLEEVRGDRDLEERFFEGRSARITPDLIAALIAHHYTHGTRELQSLMWLAVETSPGRALILTPELAEELGRAGAPGRDVSPELDAERVREALAESGGSVSAAARRLGLTSRYVLYRFLRKSDIR